MSIITRMRNLFTLQTMKASQPTQQTIETGSFDPSPILKQSLSRRSLQLRLSRDIHQLSHRLHLHQQQTEEIYQELEDYKRQLNVLINATWSNPI